ncbi:phasin family protein [Pseudanabaena sp. FACHB-1277]|uniref:Phasin family protein n=1 Tax=Pseudanabaena cinerea FACHB-1277 TaxID=2949581 RepID=A0A926UTW8_9CYAN|nr:phasin family protein [Pseudanabaena cinerea]MBD2151194.1 phasin family protein [Pseudanabaena cinerea FACHB-1277]
MNPFGGIVQKAFYLGMGLATVASEKASSTLSELRTQASKLADELVERGEMTTEEAKKFVDDLVRNAQKPIGENPSPNPSSNDQPRAIAIDDEDDEPTTSTAKSPNDVDALKSKVQALQDELRRLQQ